MNYHRPSYTITYPDDNEDILKDFPLMSSLMQKNQKTQSENQSNEKKQISINSINLSSPQVERNSLYQLRRNFLKLEKQKTEESYFSHRTEVCDRISNIPRYSEKVQINSPSQVIQNNQQSLQVPQKLKFEESHNNVAINYEIKKPKMNCFVEKENIINNQQQTFQGRLQKDVQKRQGKIKKHDEYLRKSTSVGLQNQQQQIYRTINQIQKCQSIHKSSTMLGSLKQQLDKLFIELQDSQNQGDVSKQLEEIELIKEYYKL